MLSHAGEARGLGPTIDELLAARAVSHPNTVFLRFADGDRTFSEVHAAVERLAGGFAGIGVRPGDVVPVLLPNSAEFVITWLALCRLGAIACLLNTAFRGPALQHALCLTDAHTLVLHDSLVEAVSQVAADVTALQRVVHVGGARGVAALANCEHHDLAELAVATTSCAPAAHGPAHPAMVLFTSGTTGPSKGCVLSHRYTVRQAELMIEHLQLRSDDVLYCPFPLFHIDATVLTVAPALALGATAAIGERYSASGFWPELRRFGGTVFDFMGATLTMTYKQPPAAADAANPARLAWGVPVPDWADDFERRFGVQLVELYGSTDAGIPMYHPVDVPRRPGSCGTVVDAYDVRLIDDAGFEVAPGEVGEIAVRPNEPSLMSDGYLGMPEATVRSRRNLWFHTGDLARRDADGLHYFVGRRADSIRRRGENISAFEVEEVVKLHPAVLDAAAFGVPSELTEDDVMVAVVLRHGEVLDGSALTEFCAERMARHMVPRYVDVVVELPRTPTEKVRKDALRDRGVTATTWDRERA
ncbi:MAG: AMP-binding protein [Ilumatobacteraceae bacterium]